MSLHLTSIREVPTDEGGDLSIVLRLDDLTAWEDNPRKTGRENGMDELCASIKAHGLLQSLVIQMQPDGTALVIAGERRLKALKRLAANGDIAADTLVPCRMATPSQDIGELALAENAVREPMHPADQFEAFMDLHYNGWSDADIAARFGLTETVVKQRRKLASLSDAVLQAYRDGKINLDQAQGFTVNRDHRAQEAVLERLVKEFRPDMEWSREEWDGIGIRQKLVANEVTAGDRRVKLVTLDAYVAAGGTVSHDLFSDDEDFVFIDNVALLDKLATEKLNAVVAGLKESGWNWAEYRKEFDYAARQTFIELDEDGAEPTPAQEAERERLEKLSDELSERWDDIEADDPEAGKLARRMDEVERQIHDLDNDIAGQWPDAVKAIAGAVVTLSVSGKINTAYVVHKDNKNELEKIRSGETVSVIDATNGEEGDDREGEAPKESEKPESVKLPPQLIETLTAHKSAAIGHALSRTRNLALAAAVYALAKNIFPDFTLGPNAVDIRLTETSYPLHWRREEGHCIGLDQLSAREEELAGLISDSNDLLSLWYWLLAQPQDKLLEILAYCAGRSVDTIVTRHNANVGGVMHGNAIAQQLGLDMTEYFTPTAENYFNHVGKATILNDLAEALGRDPGPDIRKLKKEDLAARAEREVKGTGWLPRPLRIPARDEEV